MALPISSAAAAAHGAIAGSAALTISGAVAAIAAAVIADAVIVVIDEACLLLAGAITGDVGGVDSGDAAEQQQSCQGGDNEFFHDWYSF